MNQMKRRIFLRVGLGSAAVLVAPKTFAAEKALDLSSKQVAALFSEFAQTKKMSPELKAWLDDPVIQKIPPYKDQTFFSVCKIETCTCRKNLDAVRQSGNHRTVIF